MSLKKPLWIADNPLIETILSVFLDKLDKDQQRISITVSEKTTPELFHYNEHDCDALWSLIEDLENEYQLLRIIKKKPNMGVEVYRGAQLKFNLDKESLLREWLNRPKSKPYSALWGAAYESVANCFGETGTHLLHAKLSHPHKSAEEILECFVRLSAFFKDTHSVNSLRALSAQFFWGDSKYLDNKRDLITSVFPSASHNIRQRPILITVFIPSHINQVLFIENQDTYLELLTLQEKLSLINRSALVYSSGFKGAASRIRKPGHTVFALMNRNISNSSLDYFEQWWFERNSQLDSFFWGDFDYSGMAILAALKKVFPNLLAWKPGYQSLLKLALHGQGHYPKETNKTEQKDPGQTGCAFSDTKLLPLLRKNQKFIDQEAVPLQSLNE